VKIHTFDQYSPEWWAARKGVITASEVGAFVVNSGKVAEKARTKLLCKKLGEHAGQFEEVFPNDAMKRGTALEPFARKAYADLMGYEVTEVGFISHDHLPLGCSPDGLIYEGALIKHGLEIKCPSAATHISWLMADELPDDYAWQVHMSMILAQADRWDFFAYCPLATFQKEREAWTVRDIEEGAIPPFHKIVHRSRFTDDLERGLKKLCEQYADMKQRMARLYSEVYERRAVA
jgi:putative phage-type endonuclease